MIEELQSPDYRCPRCGEALGGTDSEILSWNVRCHKCQMFYRCASNRGEYYELMIINPPRDVDDTADGGEQAILLRWYLRDGIAYVGTRFQHKRRTAMDVGWPPFNIDIDSVKIWITFS